MDKDIFRKIVRQMKRDKDRNNEFAAYDDMDAMKWEAPPSLTKEDWMIKYVDTLPNNALKTACDIFNTHRPHWEIMPRGEGDREFAKRLERWLDWQMQRANQRGGSEPFREVLEHAVKYGRVCGRLDYLHYWLSGELTLEQRSALADGAYALTLYHPGTVYASEGKYGLIWVACVENVYATDAAEYWSTYASDNTKEARRIKAAVNALNKLAEEDEFARVVLADYTDHEKRQVVAIPAAGDSVNADTLELGDDAIVLFNGENKLKFIPWVVVQGRDDPLLAPAHRGKLWENSNIYKTAMNSATLGRLFFPIFNVQTLSGNDDVVIDFSGGTPVIKTKQGQAVSTLVPPPADPAVREMHDRANADLARTLAIQSFGGDIKSNVQFATLNAFLQVQKTSLEPAKRLAELFLSRVGKMAFLWVMEAGESPISYVRKPDRERGAVYEQIQVSPEDFDPDTLFVSCQFNDNTPTDEQQRLNTFATAKQYGLPITDAYILERMNWGINPEEMVASYEEEQIRKSALQAEQRRIMGEAETEIQAQMAQVQMQTQMQAQQMQAMQQQAMQQQSMQQQPPPGEQTPPSFAPTDGNQGFMPGMGGESPMQANPAMTQTQINPDEVVPA